MVREMDFVDECYADKDLSLLKKLTLVIPTYNRNYYLSRCLWYHAHFPFGQIIVADSSPEEKKGVNRETVAKVREMFGADILYLEYEPETEKYGGDIYRKWGDAVMHVETDYSIITTDKQFLYPLSLKSRINYLEENKEYVSAEGMRYWVERNNGGYKYLIGRDFHETPSIVDDSPLERYLASEKYDSDGLFMLYNSSIHKQIYTYLLKSDISDIRFGESFLRRAGYIFGKSYMDISDISLCRDVIHVNRSGRINASESSSQRYMTIEDYKSIGIYNQLYANYKSAVTQLLSLSGNSDGSVNDSIFTQNHSEKKSGLLYLFVVNMPILYNIWKKTPKIIKTPIRYIFGYDDSKYYISDISYEISIIERIISESERFHSSDTPII
ncbi:MAG: TIGR00180 family glycosyltransferase [Methanocorpusculum parvum]|nr:TIGR00180 family glycosyltransferase [Methanocorpusculum parvum]